MKSTMTRLGLLALIVLGTIGHKIFRTSGENGLKQTVFMTLITLLGIAGTILHPFWGVLLYYTFAVLRPQHLWVWALPQNIRWSLLAAGAAIIGVLLSLPRVMVRANWNPIATLSSLFAVLVMVSCLMAFRPDVAASAGVEYAKIFIMASLATLVIDRLDHVRYTAMMIFMVIGYVSWEINNTYIFDGRLDIYHKGYGGLDNNGAGLLMAMGIPFAYAFFRNAATFMGKAVCVMIGLMMIHAVMMSFSRGAMIAALVGIVWILWHHRPWRQTVVITAGLLIAIAYMAGPEIRARFFSIENYEQDASAVSRLDSWAAAWKITWDYPFFGVGPRNSNLFSQTYGADIAGRTIHSQYLQIGADSGFLAMCLYLVIGWLSLRYTARVRTRVQALHEKYQNSLESAAGLNAPARDAGNDAIPSPRRTKRIPTPPRVGHEYALIALAIQTSLLIFFFGGIFLSMEIVELPWLLLMLAGVMPGLVERRLHPPIEKPDAPLIRPVPAHPHQPGFSVVRHQPGH